MKANDLEGAQFFQAVLHLLDVIETSYTETSERRDRGDVTLWTNFTIKPPIVSLGTILTTKPPDVSPWTIFTNKPPTAQPRTRLDAFITSCMPVFMSYS